MAGRSTCWLVSVESAELPRPGAHRGVCERRSSRRSIGKETNSADNRANVSIGDRLLACGTDMARVSAPITTGNPHIKHFSGQRLKKTIGEAAVKQRWWSVLLLGCSLATLSFAVYVLVSEKAAHAVALRASAASSVVISQPADWTPFSADVQITHAARPETAYSHFFRDVHGCGRLETGPKPKQP